MKKVLFTIGIIAVLVGVAFAGMAASSKTTNNWDTVAEMINSLDQKIAALQDDVTAIKDDVRPGSEKFQADLDNLQLAVSTFFSDLHAGWKDVNGDDNPNDATTFNDNVWGRTNPDTVLGHYYPTAIAYLANNVVTASTTQFDPIRVGNALLLGSSGLAATDAEIQTHAIWMGLLENGNGTGTTYAGLQDRDLVSPLAGEWDRYISQIPLSALGSNSYNGCPGCCGHYCWVVGMGGEVYGAYKSADGNWYSGFNCSYP